LSLNRKRLKIKDLSNIKSMNFKWKEGLSNDTIHDMNEMLSSHYKKFEKEI